MKLRKFETGDELDLTPIINFTKSFETFKDKPYIVNGQTLIGYGSANPNLTSKPQISEREASKEVENKYNYLLNIAKNQIPNWELLSNNVKYALLDTMYNGGEQVILSKSPKLLEMLKKGITDGKQLAAEMDHSKSAGGWLGVRSAARRAMAQDAYNWDWNETDKYGRQIDHTLYQGTDDWKASPYYNKYQKGGSLVYTSFVPELINKRNKETINKPLVFESNSRYPVESVSVYKPKPIETSASGNTTPVSDPVSDPIVDTIERLSVNGANNDNLNAINKELKNAGYKKTQRAAILATIVAESGANPTAIGDAGKAKGLFQWHPNRFNAGIDLDSQIQWLLTEIKDRNNVNAWTSSRKYNKDSAYDLFHNTEDLNEAISVLTSNYIRPANTDREIAKRYNIAQQLISQMV